MEIVHSFPSTIGEINILMIVYECVCRSSLHIMIHGVGITNGEFDKNR